MSNTEKLLEILDKELNLDNIVFTGGTCDQYHTGGEFNLDNIRDIDILYTKAALPKKAMKFLKPGYFNLTAILTRNFNEKIFYGTLPGTDIRVDIFVGTMVHDEHEIARGFDRVKVMTADCRLRTLNIFVTNLSRYRRKFLNKIDLY